MTTSRGPVLSWRKSGRSQGADECVELAGCPSPGGGPATTVMIRDSKAPDGPMCRLGAAQFAVFLRRVKRGDHDL